MRKQAFSLSLSLSGFGGILVRDEFIAGTLW